MMGFDKISLHDTTTDFRAHLMLGNFYNGYWVRKIDEYSVRHGRVIYAITMEKDGRGETVVVSNNYGSRNGIPPELALLAGPSIIATFGKAAV